MILTISTPYGNRYHVNERGEIAHPGQPFSPKWLLLGIVEVKRFTPRAMIPLATITPEWLKDRRLTFKTSGNPVYTAVDRDHGTLRLWGNTRHHGIQHLYFQTEKAIAEETAFLKLANAHRR